MKMSKNAARKLVAVDERVAEVQNADPTYLTERADFAQEIGALWHDVREKFLRIGRLLARAKLILPRGEFDRMIATDLPFNTSIAYQLRAVAEAVDTGRLSVEELPRAYSVAYQLTTLTDDGVTQARQAGLVHPAVRRTEIVLFKQSMAAPTPDLVRIRMLRSNRMRLLEQIRSLETELRGLGVDPNELNEEAPEEVPL
jgi:hypothetical protein